MSHWSEKVGDQFSDHKFQQARIKTIRAVESAAAQAFVGMTEQDGHALLDNCLQLEGVERLWHPHKFRIGSNTMKSFREASDSDVTLQPHDLFFIDIGPVFHGHEGDYGQTFSLDLLPEDQDIFLAAKNVFKTCEKYFKESGRNGIELYNYADEQAGSLGFELNRKMYGHRLGDFPHALHCKEPLGKQEHRVSFGLWVLEIHIVDPKRNKGSFFEDLILK